MVKIIFFDIDGTLLKLKHHEVSENVKTTLNALKEKGIKLFIATGRPAFVMPKFEGIDFDGAVCYNGQYAFHKEGVIYKNALDKNDVRKVVENALLLSHQVQVASDKRMLCNGYEEALDEYFKMVGMQLYFDDAFENIYKEDIYEMMIAAKAHEFDALLKDTTTLKAVSWWPKAVDIIAKDCSKALAIEKVLAHYGFSKEEAMAFGDGNNDIEMLLAVGCGIAMGNATDNVKAIADYITDSVEEDGICSACRHFHLL